MHSYLIIGNNSESIKAKTAELAKKLSAKIIEYPLNKIEDTRNLNSFLRLTLDEPTLIVCKNIQNGGTEALNAFLKNLEEPQENVYFALSAESIRKVLPTIVSRCQIVRVGTKMGEIKSDEIEEFLMMSPGQKLAFFDKIRDREKAIEFVQNLIFFLHQKREFKNMEALTKTLTGLNANGNVNLTLTNLVTKYG